MADNFNPDEVQRIFDDYNNAIKSGAGVSEQLAKDYKDAIKGVKNYTDNLNKSLQQLGKSSLGIARSLKDGKKGASVYNDAIGSAADVVANVASQFGILGAVFGAVVKSVGAYAKAVTKQSDALYDAYQDMGKIGATGSEGVTGVFKKMQKFGYGIEELGAMTDLLAENGDLLQAMGGTATQGVDAFANLASSIQRSDVGAKLQRMGMGIDDINKGAAAFMRQEMMLGINRKMSTEDLKQRTAEYLYQQDKYAKLTGKSAEQVQSAINAAMAQEQFNQTMREAELDAQAGDENAKNQVNKLKEIIASNLPEDIKDELKRAIGGDFGAAEKLAKIAPDALRLAMDRKASTAEFMDNIANGMSENIRLRGSQAKLNTYGEDYGSLAEQRKFLAQVKQPGGYAALEKSATENQAVTDKVTESATDLRISQKNTRDGLQSMLQEGVAPLTKAIATISKGAEVVSGKAATAVGAKPAGAVPIGGKAPPTTPAAPAQKISGMEDIKKMIIAHEGIRLQPYKDTKGLWTVGVGHLIGDGKTLPPDMNRTFTMKEVMDMFESDFAHHVRIAEQTPGYNKANETGKGALIDLAYNMGKWWTKFPNTSKALEAGDFKAAAAGLRDSAWFKQVGQRGPQIVAMVESGGSKGYKEGGMPSGPNSGYQATLHGTEAVVPMKSNKKLPIDIEQLKKGFAERGAALEKNLNKLDDLVRIMRDQVSLSEKQFRQAH